MLRIVTQFRAVSQQTKQWIYASECHHNLPCYPLPLGKQMLVRRVHGKRGRDRNFVLRVVPAIGPYGLCGGWNGASGPMQSIGKTPVHIMLFLAFKIRGLLMPCLGCLGMGLLSVFVVRTRSDRMASPRSFGKAGARLRDDVSDCDGVW